MQNSQTQELFLLSVRLLNDLHALIHVAQDFACMLEECHAFRSERDAPCGAMQKFSLQKSFELLNMIAQRRLADSQPGRSAAKVSFFGDGNEISKFLNIQHCSDFQMNNSLIIYWTLLIRLVKLCRFSVRRTPWKLKN